MRATENIMQTNLNNEARSNQSTIQKKQRKQSDTHSLHYEAINNRDKFLEKQKS